MANVFVTTQTTLPGVYIGRVNQVSPTGPSGFVRLPCYVGQGNRLQTIFNQRIIRSFLRDVALPFPSVSPHVVTLAKPALNDQTVAVLMTSKGDAVAASKWKFIESTPGSGVYDTVLLSPEAFKANVSYFLDYQSTSRDIQDELSAFVDLREMRLVGDSTNQDFYQEYTDYYVPVSITSPIADTDNLNSNAIDRGFEPAELTSTVLWPATFTGSEAVTINFNGSGVTAVTLPSGAVSADVVAASLNSQLDASEGFALSIGGTLVLRSSNLDPAVTSVVVAGADAADLMGTSLSYSGAMVHHTVADSSTVMTVGGSTTKTTLYNRSYRVVLTDVSGPILATVHTQQDSGSSLPEAASGATLSPSVVFNANPIAGTQPEFPLHSSYTDGAVIQFTASTTSTATFTDITGDIIEFSLTDTGSAAVNDEFVVSSVGPSFLELESSLGNTKQHSSFSAVSDGVYTGTDGSAASSVVVSGAAGDGTVSIASNSEFTGSHNRRYILICTGVTGSASTATATFVWQSWGEIEDSASGTISISAPLGTSTGVILGSGVYLDFDFGATNFTVDDCFWFQANADKSYVTAKDDRDYILDVATVGVSGTDNVVTFQYQTGTVEGSFNLVQTQGPEGELSLPGGVGLWARNVGSKVTTANRYALGDQWTFSTMCEDVIDWSLTSKVTETIDPASIYTDSLGVVTGTTGLRYLVLEEVPLEVLYIRDTVSGNLITSYSIPSTDLPYIAFSVAPSNPVEVRYIARGSEPSPANSFYVTANVLRPRELYNVPLRAFSYEDAGRLLGPSATSNHLLIMAQIALEDNSAPGAYFCQAYDMDGDDVITPVDVSTAVLSTDAEKNLTDVVVLNTFAALPAALSNNEKMNDPLERGERALWVGCPIGMALGDANTAGTIGFLAKNTLQVFGDSPAHGKRVCVAHTEARKTITLSDGTQTSVTLDGSFVAGAVAALNASFSDPGETILRKNLYGFDYVNTYTEPEQLQLVGFGAVFLSNHGTDDVPVYRVEESTTVDTTSADNNEISVAINQKEYTTREIRRQMDDALIAIVPPSEQAGIAIIQTYLVSILANMVSGGIIAPYTDESGANRPIDPNGDVLVFRARDGKTSYNFKYWWNARYPVKRLFGLYSTDRKFWGDSV